MNSRLFWGSLLLAVCLPYVAQAEPSNVEVRSPDGRNRMTLSSEGDDEVVHYTISRDDRVLIKASPVGAVLASSGNLGTRAKIAGVQRGDLEESFDLPWGKTKTVLSRCSWAVASLKSAAGTTWEIELRAFDDGVAFCYRIPTQPGLSSCEIVRETTQFNVAGRPTALFNTLESFTTSHETLYDSQSLAKVPVGKLIDMPMLLEWPDGTGAALTEARVLDFAGAYLERSSPTSTSLSLRLSPLPDQENACIIADTPVESPWRVLLLADVAGQLLESNLLLCLNEPPQGNFDWLRPGKSTFHWWYGAFEDDHELPAGSDDYYRRHCEYIDFCAENNIAYHSVSGDGLAWYQQSEIDYSQPAPDADILTPRQEIQLPRILEYARERGVDIRLWLHWKPLSENLDEAFATYQSWGVKGLMVDFLDRDDQEMIEFTERMLESGARHNLHIQIHGSSKYSGEQRRFPNLFNREGVLNLEYLKWSDLCTPDHSVNVAYTRALAGPVDFHLGGFRSVPRTEFRFRDRAPVVMGTRCHHLALYVVYENPMPFVADDPSAYEGQTGFDFVTSVPTTWDETKFVMGDAGEYVVLARRSGEAWYLAGITNWTPRELAVPLDFLDSGDYEVRLYVDGSMDESQPNAVQVEQLDVNRDAPLHVSLAPGGGFVGVVKRQ